jgi:oxygen-dependent protoporphyrinogen oxidase
VQHLLEAAGLLHEVVHPMASARKRFIVRNGKLLALPTGPLSLLGTRLVGWHSKWRILTEGRRPLQALTPQTTVAQLLAQRFSPEVVDYIADPFVAGVFAGDVQRLSAQFALAPFIPLMQQHGSLLRGQLAAARARRAQGLPPAPPIFSLPQGLQQWMDALANKLGPNLHTGLGVTRINPQPGGNWNLTLANGQSLVAQEVTHTLPAEGLLATVEQTPLHAPLHTALHDLEHPPVAMLSLGFRRQDVAHPLDGFGLLVPSRERAFRILGALFPSSLFAQRAPQGCVLLAVFVGGSRAPHLAKLPQPEMERMVVEDLNRLLGVRGAPLLSHLRVWPRAIPQYDTRHAERLAALQALEAQYPTLHLVGNYRGGIGVPARAAASA